MTSRFIDLRRKKRNSMTEDDLQSRIDELQRNIQKNLGDVVRLRVELDNLKKIRESKTYDSNPRLLQE